MPKSKLRINRKKSTAMGSSLSQRRLSKTDTRMKMNAYNDKVEKYSKLSLDELMEMYTDHIVGGVYREALQTVIKQKQEV